LQADLPFSLHHTEVGSRDAEKKCFVLHGVLGSGQNFRSLAKRLSESSPAWQFVLVDLRLHGQSQGAPPPHTLETCVDDLEYLAQQLGAPAAVVGHSFGGKVALGYAARAPQALEQTFVLDSDPGASVPGEDHDVSRVMRTLARLPDRFTSREDFIEGLTGQGIGLATARWLSQNLVREPEAYRWRLDLGAINGLLSDYFARDLWHVFEAPPPGQMLHLVIAESSQRLDRAARQRLGELSEHPRVALHIVPNAGHWLHVDNPEGLLAILRPEFSQQP
jgi:esterase